MKFYINKLCIEIEYSLFLMLAFSILIKNYDILFVLLFSALHELGHLILLYAAGGKCDKLTAAYYGIGLKHSCALSVNRELLFLCGGLIINLVFVLANIKREINLALLFINILPVYPLDGGRILKLILNKCLSLNISDKIYITISIFIFVLLFTISIYLKNISLILISVYVVVYSLNNSID